MHLPYLYPALLALLSLSPSTTAAKPKTPNDAILLSSVRTLTLRNNAMTSHRRVPAVPQLTCKGPGCKHYKIDILRCTNAGSSYGAEEVEWACTASLPEEFKLGSTDVVCEGYSNRDDEYILKGSCGVEYRLLLTDKGEEKYGSASSFWGSKPKNTSSNSDAEGWTWSSVLFVLVFLGVLGWIVYSAYQAAPAAGRRIPRRPGGFWGGGWGGGGAGGGDPFDPPPPYPGTGRKNYGQQQGWQPGFWTGALGGAAAGYMAGNRGNRQEPAPQQRDSSWFGGGGSSGGFNNAPARSSSSSSSSYSNTRHESTGFGSTSRR